MRWQPANNDLLGAVIPEEVDSHAETILVSRSFDEVELQECSIVCSDGIVDVVCITFLPSARLVNGPREFHAKPRKRGFESFVSANPVLPLFDSEKCFSVPLRSGDPICHRRQRLEHLAVVDELAILSERDLMLPAFPDSVQLRSHNPGRTF